MKRQSNLAIGVTEVEFRSTLLDGYTSAATTFNFLNFSPLAEAADHFNQAEVMDTDETHQTRSNLAIRWVCGSWFVLFDYDSTFGRA